MKPTRDLSGPVIHQNATSISTRAVDAGTALIQYQEFYLPDDYVRGDRVPSLAGFQLTVSVATGHQFTAALDWTLDHKPFGENWQTLASGTTIGAAAEGPEVPFDVYLNDPVALTAEDTLDLFRFSFIGRSTSALGSDVMLPVTYDGKTANVYNQNVQILMEPDIRYPVTIVSPSNAAERGFLYMDDNGNVTYSTQRGVDAVHFSVPNPLEVRGASAKDNTYTTIQFGGINVSFLFHIYAGIADAGTDFLGSTYRSVVVKQDIANVTTEDSNLANAVWLSKPNPSKFAVDSAYFDIRDNGDAAVVDRILLNPITPGIYCNVYYSNEGDPATTVSDWEQKLWSRVPTTFHLTKRDTYVLPQPITAKYVCLEFTHLLEKPYSPGPFQKPISYKKHPKWVLDYFLLQTDLATEDPFIAKQVEVTYNALDLAFNYYLDDLQQDPADPSSLGFQDPKNLNAFLSSSDIDQLDPITLSKISTVINPYVRHISEVGDSSLLSVYQSYTAALGIGTNSQGIANSPEQPTSFPPVDPIIVAPEQRAQIIFEKQFPVMFFFIDCRHYYREVQALFRNDRAYFAGLRELAFFRDHYNSTYDGPIYVEHGGDLDNSELSDFFQLNGVLQPYDDTT